MDRPTHAGLRHLALNVRDLNAMKRFYVEVLGFTIEWEPDGDNVYLSSGLDNLALHRSTRIASQANDRSEATQTDPGPLDHFGLIVRSPEDVDRWAEFLQRRGIALDARPRTHRDGARSCYFRDPEGNRIQLIHHPPISDKV